MSRCLVAMLDLCAMLALLTTTSAQSVAASSCATFKDVQKNPAQVAPYLAYLEGYANATSPDPRFTQSQSALADDAKQVLNWCKKNSKSTYASAVAAVLNSPVTSANADPTSCRVGPTTYCAGCSVTCSGGKQATCELGRDSDVNKWCLSQARCVCK